MFLQYTISAVRDRRIPQGMMYNISVYFEVILYRYCVQSLYIKLHLCALRLFFYAGMDTGIEISASLEARDLLFFGWTCRISENCNGKGPDFKEMGVLACLHLAVISYTGYNAVS